MNKEKLDLQVQKNLFSTNLETTISALKVIKERGNKLYLPILFDLMASNPEYEIKNEIIRILGTIKKVDTIPLFIEALQTKRYKPIRKTLLTACWQNGLDFRRYLPLFVELIIEEDWETGFEAFTVIENMENFEKETVDATVVKIHDAIENTHDKKKYLLEEILTIIQ